MDLKFRLSTLHYQREATKKRLYTEATRVSSKNTLLLSQSILIVMGMPSLLYCPQLFSVFLPRACTGSSVGLNLYLRNLRLVFSFFSSSRVSRTDVLPSSQVRSSDYICASLFLFTAIERSCWSIALDDSLALFCTRRGRRFPEDSPSGNTEEVLFLTTGISVLSYSVSLPSGISTLYLLEKPGFRSQRVSKDCLLIAVCLFYIGLQGKRTKM